MQGNRKSVPNELKHEAPQRELRLLRRHRESNSMLAILMAGIAGLFILAIIAAYNYASNTSVAYDTAPRPTAGAPAASVPAEQATPTRAETTGTGGSERGATEPGQRDQPLAR